MPKKVIPLPLPCETLPQSPPVASNSSFSPETDALAAKWNARSKRMRHSPPRLMRFADGSALLLDENNQVVGWEDPSNRYQTSH